MKKSGHGDVNINIYMYTKYGSATTLAWNMDSISPHQMLGA
jgi:hypothetical protein